MNVKVCPANDMSSTSGYIALLDIWHISQLVMFGLARRCAALSMIYHTSPHLMALAHLSISSSPSIACLQHDTLHAH